MSVSSDYEKVAICIHGWSNTGRVAVASTSPQPSRQEHITGVNLQSCYILSQNNLVTEKNIAGPSADQLEQLQSGPRPCTERILWVGRKKEYGISYVLLMAIESIHAVI